MTESVETEKQQKNNKNEKKFESLSVIDDCGFSLGYPYAIKAQGDSLMENIINYYSDEELDSIFETDKETNSFESLTPLLIHEILRTEHVGESRKISQKKLGEILEDRYEIKKDRRSLSRILYTLQVYGMGVVVTREGIYYDPFLAEYAA